MIKLYIYQKDSGVFLREETGTEESILNVISVPEDFTLTAPPTFSREWVWNGEQWEKPKITNERIAILQEREWELIKQQRQFVIESGILLSSINKVFQTDQNSMSQYSNIASMIALDNYTPVEWKTLDNTWVTLTVELFKELQQTIRQRTDRVFAIAEDHKDKMMKSDNPEEYDYSTGWEVSVS